MISFLRYFTLLREGGWSNAITQGTIIHPPLIRKILIEIKKVVADFNHWTKNNYGQFPIEVDSPLGSSAYYEQDDESTVYGDIDILIITPDGNERTPGRSRSYWNKLFQSFIKETKPENIHRDSKEGHPIFITENNECVQVDLLFCTEKNKAWYKARLTPERGLKGAAYGKIFTALGDTLTASIQDSGVQVKISYGKRMNYANTKSNYKIEVISTNISTFAYDILMAEIGSSIPANEIKVDPLLDQNRGVDVNNITALKLLKAVKGLGKSFEQNKLFGKGHLEHIKSLQNYYFTFISKYAELMDKNIGSSKRDKAIDKQKAINDVEKVKEGKDRVIKQFNSIP